MRVTARRIRLEEFALHASIGIHPEEKRARQRVIVSVELEVSAIHAGKGDRIEDMLPERAFELLAIRREQIIAKGGEPAKKARATKSAAAKKAAPKKAAARKK